jgi:hypothetical protein
VSFRKEGIKTEALEPMPERFLMGYAVDMWTKNLGMQLSSQVNQTFDMIIVTQLL